MSHWTDLRALARQHAAELHQQMTGDYSAEHLLRTATAVTGIKQVAVAADDPLLDGGDATYAPLSKRIWYNRDTELELSVFHRAHEFAHHWLGHSDGAHCQRTDLDPETPEEPVPVGIHRIQGYGPKERRERDANVFARELLLPTDRLRHWYIADGLTAQAIATRVGVPIAMVFHQLAYALLIADLPRIQRATQQKTVPTTLDKSQKAAAYAPQGPLLLEAGPGTGKTRTLVARVERLLDTGVEPEAIVALTFSNKAAEEMRERVARSAPEKAHRIWMGTFHAFGLELLRKYGTRIGLPTNPPIVDPVDAMFLLERELTQLNLVYYQHLPEPTKHFKAILSAISRAKDELVSPEQYETVAQAMRTNATTEEDIEAAEKALEVARVYAVYQAYLDDNKLLDFGDLIARSVTALQNPETGIREAERSRIQHVLVDEYQDVNRASAMLLKELVGDGRGLWVVGDARQSVYRFRGASPENMERFTLDFPGGTVKRLAVNYRSQAPIVKVISQYAAGMPSITDEPFVPWQASRQDTNGKVRMEIASNADAEGDWIAREIERYRNARELTYGDQAVLARSHTNLTRIANRLERAHIPILYLGDLFERPEIRDLLSLLSLACQPDGRGLIRVARFPEYDIPLRDVQALIQAARERDTPFPTALAIAGTLDTVTEQGKRGLALLTRHLEDLCFGKEAWTLLVYYLFDRSGYLRPILQDTSLANQQRRLALYQFLQFAYEQRRSAREGHLLDQNGDPKRALLRFIRRLAMISDDTQLRQLPDWASDVDAVRLLTVHASKGLQFPVVFIPVLAKGKFPASKKANACPTPAAILGSGRDVDTDHQHEEDCLLFVAISRAEDVLCLSRAVTYDADGKRSNPSDNLARLDTVLPRPASSTTITWPSLVPASPESAQTPLLPRDPLPLYTANKLDTYITCPRRYYYNEVLGLGNRNEDTAYLNMHRCVYKVLRWMTDTAQEGNTITEEKAVTQLAEAWSKDGPLGHPYVDLYHKAATSIIQEAVRLAGTRATKASQPDWTVAFAQGRVTLSPDGVQMVNDGTRTTVVVQRFKTGRPSSSEIKADIYGLFHTAAQQAYPDTAVRLEVVYLATGTSEPVTAKLQTLAGRAAKYNTAMEGIHRQEFPPTPDEYECPRCPNYFICPHAEDDVAPLPNVT